MVQHFLNPQAIPVESESCRAPDELPPAVRKLGHICDLTQLWPGDLILVCPASRGLVKGLIQTVQETGGFAAEDARWHHAAVFLGTGFDIVEARARTLDVSIGSLLNYLPTHHIRVRRPAGATRENGWMLAMNAMKLLGKPYAFKTITALADRALRQGYWQGRTTATARQDAVICSQVFSDAFAATHGIVLGDPAIPAKLSASAKLTDAKLRWLRLQ